MRAIEVEQLTKVYGKTRAVDGISFNKLYNISLIEFKLLTSQRTFYQSIGSLSL